jgi:uncharacterized repeat protein (TIGR04076 family)
MTKIKITTLKRFTANDVFGKDLPFLPKDVPLGPCEYIREDLVYYSENLELPVAIDPNDLNKKYPFCKWAHHDIYKDMNILLLGGNFSKDLPGVKFTACSDGLKPVCFKLDRVD